MANLRTNNLSGEQGQNAYRGSVFFPGYINGAASTYLSIADNDDLDIGTGDFTFEAWILPIKHAGTNDPNYMGFFSSADYGSSGSITIQVKNDGKLRYIAGNGGDDETGSTVLWGHYHHVAIVRSGSTIKGYVNGVEEISSSYSSAIDFGTGSSTVIGELAIDNYAGDYPFKGYISNLRLVKGTAVYTSDFTPPTSELTLIPNTVLLCCQNSDDPTQEATGKTITANGMTSFVNRTDNLIKNGRFTVSATENWTLSGGTASLGTGQSGTFGDGNHLVLTASSSYAYLKQSFTTVIGRTYLTDAQSNGGDASFISTSTSDSDYIISDIRGGKSFIATQTTYHVILRASTGGGNFDTVSVHELENKVPPKVIPPFGVDAGNTFGGPIQQSSEGYMYFPTGGTEERGGGIAIVAGGYSAATSPIGTIESIRIQTMGNSMSFGTLNEARFSFGAVASTSRVIFGGGYQPSNLNSMEFVNPITQGNGTDAGDLSAARKFIAGLGNSTRGIFAGGNEPAMKNTIEFVTIPSLGDATDFGDLTAAVNNPRGCASPTRGIINCATAPTSRSNVINFITIASAGDAQDFGDLTETFGMTGFGLSDNTRGVIGGYYIAPANNHSNVINFVTIATTGDATDFGDMVTGTGHGGSGCSDKTRGVIFAQYTDTPHQSAPLNSDAQGAVNLIQMITVQTTGNAVEFGDLVANSASNGRKYYANGNSNSHGGLS